MSCDRHTVYNHYEHVTQGGWEKNDTLFYQVPPVKEAGTYEEIIGIRTDINFPFQSIALNIAQPLVQGGASGSQPGNVEIQRAVYGDVVYHVRISPWRAVFQLFTGILIKISINA